MYIPNGYTENEVLRIINYVMGDLARDFAFGHYDRADMKQEGFIFALEALPKFNVNSETNTPLDTFLRIHIRNRFINMVRDKFYRSTPPCRACRNNETAGCTEFDSPEECPKYLRWKKRNHIKRNIAEPIGDAPELTADIFDNHVDASEHMERTDLLDFISEHLPLRFRADYRRLLDGAPIKQARYNTLIAEIKGLLGPEELECWET